MKKVVNVSLLTLTFSILMAMVLMVCAKASATGVEFKVEAVDVRPLVERKLQDAVVGGDADSALKWAQTAQVLEQTRITHEAGEAVIPLLKGYAATTKEWQPQLEAVGPLLKIAAKAFLSSQSSHGLVPEADKKAVADVKVALDATTPGAVVAGLQPTIEDAMERAAKADVERKAFYEKQRLESEAEFKSLK